MKLSTVIFLLFSACTSQYSNYASKEHTHKLSPSDTIQIKLDSLSKASAIGLQYLEDNNSEFLVKSNFYNWRIDFYNLKNGQKERAIYLNKEGANGIGQVPSGLFYHNGDSIFLYHNLSQTIYMVNDQGELLNKINLKTQPVPIIDVRIFRPVFLLNNELHFATYDNSYNGNKTSGAILNLKTQEVRFPYHNPEIYDNGYWQGIWYDNYTHALNNKNDIVQSYGADHNIYIVDKDNHIITKNAQSEFFTKPFVPFRDKTVDFGENAQAIYKFEAIQGGYGHILYDKYQNVYYRFVIRPIKESEFYSPSQMFEQPSVIILDNEFNKIGETILPKGLGHAQSFVSRHGLCIYNKSYSQEVEDVAMYIVFKVSKNE